MSEPVETSSVPETPSSPTTPPLRAAPRAVVIATFLWALPVLAEIAVLVYVGYLVAWAASIGGPAWDYPIFIGAPLALISIVLLAIQIPCALRMRRGGRGSRIALAVVGVPTVLLAVWLTGAISDTSPNWLSLAGFGVAGGVAAAIVLTFTPRANQFFRKRHPTAAEALDETSA